MTELEMQFRMLAAFMTGHVRDRIRALREEGSDRGDGILIWVIMVALLAAAAIAVVAIIVAKAKNTANNTKTQ
jgi:hypothetical protein